MDNQQAETLKKYSTENAGAGQRDVRLVLRVLGDDAEINRGVILTITALEGARWSAFCIFHVSRPTLKKTEGGAPSVCQFILLNIETVSVRCLPLAW